MHVRVVPNGAHRHYLSNGLVVVSHLHQLLYARTIETKPTHTHTHTHTGQ